MIYILTYLLTYDNKHSKQKLIH